MRQLLLALLLAALAPAAAQGASVTIVEPDGKEHPLDLAALAPDVRDATYELRAPDGGTSPVAVPAGFSVRALLRAADVELDSFEYLEVPFGEEGALVLRDQAVVREMPPVVWEDADGLHFLAPTTGDEDVNIDDFVTAADGALRVQLQLGTPIDVRIDASARRVRRGGRIAFAAVIELGNRPGLRFEWYFDEGANEYGATRSHRFQRSGRHLVLVNILLGEEFVTTATVKVYVDPPRRARRRERRAQDDSPAERTGGTGGAGTGSGTGSGSGTTRSAGGTATPAATPTPPPLRRARARRHRPREAPGRTLVSGTLLASADAAPLAGLPRSSTAAARRDEPPQVPTGAWVALGVVLLLALGWGIEARNTLPFWRPPGDES
jgi:hypothetical protein